MTTSAYAWRSGDPGWIQTRGIKSARARVQELGAPGTRSRLRRREYSPRFAKHRGLGEDHQGVAFEKHGVAAHDHELTIAIQQNYQHPRWKSKLADGSIGCRRSIGKHELDELGTAAR